MTKPAPHNPDTAPKCLCGCGWLVARCKNGRGGRKYASGRCASRAHERNRPKRESETVRNVVPKSDNPRISDLIYQIAKIEGIDGRRLESLIQTELDDEPEGDVPENVTNEYLIKRIEQVQARILVAVNALDIKRADLKGKMVAFKSLTEMRQLLKGEPTQIRSHVENKQLSVVLEAVMLERQARGMPLTIEGDYKVEAG